MVNERDATKRTMDPGLVRLLIASRRVAEIANMERRANQIKRGLNHESYAARLSKIKREPTEK
jgi:hypothetical protein